MLLIVRKQRFYTQTVIQKKLKIRNDIISKTINFFDSKYSTKTNLSIKVVKFIPIGYGFGGGSSNASTILKYLYSYHSISDINFNHDAHIIGSDVSLFKDLFPKEIDGISIIKKKIKRRYTWKKIYLLLPSKKNSTKKIFSLYKNKKTVPKKSFIYENLNKSMIKKNIFLAKNDLIICASHYNREMSKILIYLYQNNGLFSKFGMTGTGSGLFIIF